MAKTETLLKMDNISKSFSGVQVLNRVKLELAAGEVLGLLGENGAGKSTLMKILGGIVKKDSGDIWISGKIVDIDNPVAAAQQGISIIHQELVLVPELTVAENVFLGRLPRGFIRWNEVYRKAQDLFDELGIDINPKTPVGELPIASQQMVEIARAISKNAKIIVMDEPTSSLTEKETNILFGMIEKLKQRKVGIIYISHRLEEIFSICDRITVLRDGEFVGNKARSEVTEDDVVRMMVGRDLSSFYVKEDHDMGKVALQVKGLTKTGVFKDISFEVKEGEVLGISGLLGAGRSEVARALVGIDRFDSGEIQLFGKTLKIRKPIDAVEAGIVYIPEDRKKQGLFLQRSVAENLTVPIIKSLSKFNIISKKREYQVVNGLLEKFAIRTSNPKIAIRNLSGGNQQKVLLSRWLKSPPKVLILDEPTRGVDVGAKAEIYTFINDLAKRGMAIILISSDLPEVLTMSDRILVMREGTISGEVLRDEASEEVIMGYATGIMSTSN